VVELLETVVEEELDVRVADSSSARCRAMELRWAAIWSR